MGKAWRGGAVTGRRAGMDSWHTLVPLRAFALTLCVRRGPACRDSPLYADTGTDVDVEHEVADANPVLRSDSIMSQLTYATTPRLPLPQPSSISMLSAQGLLRIPPQ